jgi:hypothetical protein
VPDEVGQWNTQPYNGGRSPSTPTPDPPGSGRRCKQHGDDNNWADFTPEGKIIHSGNDRSSNETDTNQQWQPVLGIC